ncbi:hypothetical protein [Sedimentibacter sp.]|uniref:hypothetical protein n=1 Tax=Sedimentibacter sp. TaxID=1960295 RepID=UPI00289D1516|nr:hypothetical protein [Sedimentibacter sp.]
MIDFEKEFNDFIVSNNNADPVTAIYNLFPDLSDEQIKIFLQLDYMANKYNVIQIKMFLQTYLKHKRSNKNMTFANMLSFRKTLESYSLAEHLKGVKIASQNMQREEK